MAEVTKYKYSYSPNQDFSYELEVVAVEREGHKLKWKKRVNKLRSGDVAYNTRCSCGWIDRDRGEDKYVPIRMRIVMFRKHMVEVRNQGELFND